MFLVSVSIHSQRRGIEAGELLCRIRAAPLNRDRQPRDGYAVAGDQLLAQIVNRADLVVADGIGVVWASGVLGRRLPERIAGIELTEGILAEAAAKGWPVFMLGSSDGVAQRAADALRRRYQGLQIVGTHHGFFRPGPEEEEVLERIKGAKPKVLLAALGVPRQEKWLAAHLGTLRVPVAIGVGAVLMFGQV